MSSGQLSFWDNEALEKGYRCLSNLEFKKAESHFNEALNASFGNTAHVLKAIEICREWPPVLTNSQYVNNNGLQDHINILLANFKVYHFTPPLKEFRRVLLVHIASILCKSDQMDLNNVETTFDFLLDIKCFAEAETLILEAIKQNPGNRHLLYLQAQMLWCNNEKKKATHTWIWLLLNHPREVEMERIENEVLKTLMKTHGVVMAPVYGLLHKMAPAVLLPGDMDIQDEEHRIAVECYRLILASNQSMMNRDLQASIQSRKRLKKLSPQLYEAYFKWIQRPR